MNHNNNDQAFKRMFIGILIMLLLWNGYLSYQIFDLYRQVPLSQTDENKIVEKVVTEFDTDVTRVVDTVESKVVTIISYSDMQALSSGSGVVYKNESGKLQIITNHHVIDKGDDIKVRFSTGEELDATLRGSDQYTDLALLEVEHDLDIEPFVLGDSSRANVGEFVVAVGSPVGLEFANSVTFGIISGKDRIVPVDLNSDGVSDWDMIVLQTDAAINPGNSGGALVNMQGELVGINSMKISASQIEGMGFSIPINEAIPVIQQIEKTGKVQYPLLGISAVSVSEMGRKDRAYYKLPDDIEYGVFIADVIDGGAAQLGGVKKGDILVGYDGQEVKSFKAFRRMLFNNRVGDTVSVRVNRQGELLDIEVILQ